MNSRVNLQTQQQPLGVLLIFSGTRNPAGQLQAETFVNGLKRRLGTRVIVISAYLASQKPNLQMAFRLMNDSGVQHWLCIPVQFFASQYVPFAHSLKASRYLLSQRSRLELYWMNPWGAESQFISLVTGTISNMLLNLEDENTELLLIAGHCGTTKIFHKYQDVARRMSTLLARRINSSVLAGIGPSVHDSIHGLPADTESVLLIPYLPFEGQLLHRLRTSLDTFLPFYRKVALTPALFDQQSIRNYVYSQIEQRYYQAIPIRSSTATSIV